MNKVTIDRIPARLRIPISILIAIACIFGGWKAVNAFGQTIPPSEPRAQVIPTPSGSGGSSLSPSGSAIATGLHYYKVVGAVFLPANSGYTYQYGNSGCLKATTYGYWRAPVNLPDGSIIKNITFTYKNDTFSKYSSAWITRYKYDGSYDDLAAVSSRPYTTAGVGYFSDTSNDVDPSINVVDNLNYGYTFIWSGYTDNGTGGDTSQKLCSIEVAYTPPATFSAALPLITH